MSSWRRYDSKLFPIFHQRYEQRWGKGSAPFLDPSVHQDEQPRPWAQWINVDTGAAVAVVPVWEDDQDHRSFGVFYLPPAEGIWMLYPGYTQYIDVDGNSDEVQVSLRNDAFKKAIRHAQEFIFGPEI